MKSPVSETFYKSFFEHTLDGFAYCQMVFDLDGQPIDFIYRKINKNFELLTGLKHVLGKKVTELVPDIKKSNPGLFDIYGQVALTGKPRTFEAHIKPLAKWFLISAYSTKKKFFIAIYKDITEQKTIEKDLEDANIAARNVLEDIEVKMEEIASARAKEQALFESLGEGLIAVDNDAKIIVINKSAIDMFGWSERDLMGKTITDLPLENERGKPIPHDERPTTLALLSNKIARGTYYFVRPDKTRLPIAITAAPIKLKGNILGLIEIVRNVTHELEVDRAKTEFVSLASHQLRTPLTAISWYTEMILNGDVGNISASQKKYLEEIYRGNQRMVDLVDTLLDVSRIELGKFIYKPVPTDIIPMAESVQNELKFRIHQKELVVKNNFSQNMPKINADPKFLRIVFQNLLSNAVTYTPVGGKVELSVSVEDKKTILIKVTDTGYGIPDNQKDKIFTKLFRADNAREKNTDGTGLGLYIVKSIVENSGGKIWFESVENKGSTFYVSLPIDGTKKNQEIPV